MDRNDAWYERSIDFSENYSGRFIVPVTVLPEVCYLINRYLGALAEIRFLSAIDAREIEMVAVDSADLKRVRLVLKQYEDLNIGFVDATLVAVAERLRVESVATTDRRHFSVVRPRHCKTLTLLP